MANSATTCADSSSATSSRRSSSSAIPSPWATARVEMPGGSREDQAAREEKGVPEGYARSDSPERDGQNEPVHLAGPAARSLRPGSGGTGRRWSHTTPFPHAERPRWIPRRLAANRARKGQDGPAAGQECCPFPTAGKAVFSGSDSAGSAFYGRQADRQSRLSNCSNSPAGRARVG